MATRQELLNQANDINEMYKLAFGKDLPEIIGATGSRIAGLADDELQSVIDEYGSAAENVKTELSKVTDLEANMAYYQKNYGVDWLNKMRETYGVGDLTDIWLNTTSVARGTPALPPTDSDKSSLINAAYAPQEEDLYRQVMSLASKRGGLDSGGLATSYSKGLANIKAAKAGAQIDWDKFLKGLELPTAQFDWSKGAWNKQFNVGVSQYQDQMKALQDYWSSQPKSNWYDPLVQILGCGVGGFAGAAGAGMATKLLKLE